jgi:hypothetical protein
MKTLFLFILIWISATPLIGQHVDTTIIFSTDLLETDHEDMLSPIQSSDRQYLDQLGYKIEKSNINTYRWNRFPEKNISCPSPGRVEIYKLERDGKLISSCLYQ